MPRHWRNALLRTLAGLMVCGGVGWWFGAIWPALAFGLFVAHAWLCFRMIRLERHIAAGRIDWNDDDDVVERFGARFLRWRRAERSARRRLLRALQAFRDAAAALPDAVLVIDDRERVQWANRAAERLLGIRVPQSAGSPLSELVPGAVLDWYRDQTAEPLMDVPAPHDPALRLSFRVVAYRESARLLIVREIAWLLRLERMRRDFVANVSHELRTPLTVIAGYLDVIEDDELPEYAGVLGQMRTQAQRMTRIVEDLLLLSRLDAMESAPLEPVAVRPMLKQILADVRVISDGQHRITLAAAADAPDLLGSQPHLLSAFMNLAVNAVRYTPPGGVITLRYGRTDEAVCYEVEDTGFGIPAEHIDRITERFYRVSVSRSREKGGTGLGLAIVKHVLQLHGGRLVIESEVGKGSRFRCILPAERLSAAA
jgi:two-component system phosphate regulon sensor histidine kinase PhoR